MVETKNCQNCQYSGGRKIYKNMFYVKFSTSSTKYRMLKTILDGNWKIGPMVWKRRSLPTVPRLLHKSLKSIHQSHEQEKRRAYNQRVIKVEHGSFTPLVFSTVGGQSYECGRFYNRLSTLLSEKRGEHKSQTTAYIRCKINFSLLRSALVCLRGTRSLKNTEINSSSDLVNTMAGVN